MVAYMQIGMQRWHAKIVCWVVVALHILKVLKCGSLREDGPLMSVAVCLCMLTSLVEEEVMRCHVLSLLSILTVIWMWALSSMTVDELI